MLLNEMKRSELKTFTHTYIHASVNTIRAPSNYVDYHKCVHLYTTAQKEPHSLVFCSVKQTRSKSKMIQYEIEIHLKKIIFNDLLSININVIKSSFFFYIWRSLAFTLYMIDGPISQHIDKHLSIYTFIFFFFLALHSIVRFVSFRQAILAISHQQMTLR